MDGLHVHLSLTDVDIFFVWKIFYDFNTAFDYLLMLTYFSCAKCSYHSRLMFMWVSVTETYQRSGWTSSSFVIMDILDIFFLNICTWNHLSPLWGSILFDYLLMLTIFHVQNVLIILDWCLCEFLLLKHINEVDALHLDLLFTNVDIFF